MKKIALNELLFVRKALGKSAMVLASALLMAACSNSARDNAFAGDENRSISGKTAGRGVTCFRFTLQSGEEISIVGEVGKLRVPGIRADLLGDWQDVSVCQQGRTFLVRETLIKN